MASRPIFTPYHAINAGDMSGDITSGITIVTNISLGSYMISWSGSTPVGTLTVECSNDYSLNSDGSVKNSGTWIEFPNASQSVSGNSGVGMFDIVNIGAYAIRLKYTKTSGTGTLNAYFMGKVQ